MSATPRQCSTWERHAPRCTRPAEFNLYAPGATRPVPGGPICGDCGVACVVEYAEKVGEIWTLEPLSDAPSSMGVPYTDSCQTCRVRFGFNTGPEYHLHRPSVECQGCSAPQAHHAFYAERLSGATRERIERIEPRE